MDYKEIDALALKAQQGDTSEFVSKVHLNPQNRGIINT